MKVWVESHVNWSNMHLFVPTIFIFIWKLVNIGYIVISANFILHNYFIYHFLLFELWSHPWHDAKVDDRNKAMSILWNISQSWFTSFQILFLFYVSDKNFRLFFGEEKLSRLLDIEKLRFSLVINYYRPSCLNPLKAGIRSTNLSVFKEVVVLHLLWLLLTSLCISVHSSNPILVYSLPTCLSKSLDFFFPTFMTF